MSSMAKASSTSRMGPTTRAPSVKAVPQARADTSTIMAASMREAYSITKHRATGHTMTPTRATATRVNGSRMSPQARASRNSQMGPTTKDSSRRV